MQADAQRLGWVPGLGAGTPVQLDQRCELSRLAADDGLWVPDTCVMSCDVLIFVEEATDAVASVDLADPGCCVVGKWS
ncbi:MAG: hypothetical protein QOI16_1919 [Pseudonocardiales bacterium]|nr:hypothetical protein [Pseudonocardiales bacterium]